MIVKPVVVAASAVALVSASPAPDIAFVDYPSVRQVTCQQGKGSAVQTSSGWLSVAHVTGLQGCTIDGAEIQVLEQNRDQDFSRIVVRNHRMAPVAIDCRGFVAGHYYWSSGYALGAPFQTAVRIRALGIAHNNGLKILMGARTVIPGMSGGAVFSDRGVVGVINAYNPLMGLSFSRELRETSVCK